MDVKHQIYYHKTLHRTTAYRYGFTLIELLAVLAIVAIITAVAIPSLQSFFTKNYTTSQLNTLVADLNLARIEAIKRNNEVVICESNNGIHCSNTKQWMTGWIIFNNTNSKNRKRDENENIIRIQIPLKGSNDLKYRGLGNSTTYIRFYPTGAVSNNGTFTLCSENSNYNRAVIIARTGRVRLSNTTADGDPITCNNYS